MGSCQPSNLGTNAKLDGTWMAHNELVAANIGSELRKCKCPRQDSNLRHRLSQSGYLIDCREVALASAEQGICTLTRLATYQRFS